MSTSDHPRAVISRGDRAGLWLTAGGAGAIAVFWVVALVITSIETLSEEPLAVPGMEIVNASTPAFTEPLAAITSARYESAAVTVADAPSSTRWLIVAASLVAGLAIVGVCLALVWLCVRMLRLRPFGRSMTVALVTAAILIMVGGLGSQFLAAGARAELVQFLGPEAVGRVSAEQSGGAEHFMAYALSLDLAPLGIGLALAVVALAFQLGARMQRDTEGLV